MKILLVSANPDVLPYLKSQPALADSLFVQYSHPLKALDNMAEVDPDIIVWSADDYPRHWKLARVFCPARPMDHPVMLFLITDKGLDEEEEAKAQMLEIDDLVEDGFFGDSLVQILERQLPKPQSETAPVAAMPPGTPVAPAPGTNPHELPEGDGMLLLIHPDLQQLMIGTITGRDQGAILVTFPDPDDAQQFPAGLYADNATIRIGSFSREAILKVIPPAADGALRFLILHLAEKGR